MERVERLLLELAHAFGTHAEVGAEAAQRLHRPVEAIAAAQDRLLAARQARDPREKARERQPAGRTLIRLLGRWVRQPLTETQQTILRGRYGLDGPVQTLRGLGADLGISAERVRQLEQQALDTLHAAATQAPTSS